MSTELLTVRPEDPLPTAARAMTQRRVQAAIVRTGGATPGIVTSRDVLELVGSGADPASGRVADRFTAEATAAAAGWSLEQAGRAMVDGGFRHLLVREGDETVGIVAIRDIVEWWVGERVRRAPAIQIREAMRRDFLAVGRDEAIARTARQMVERGVGAAIIEPPKRRAPPQMITDRDVLALVAAGGDPTRECVADHVSPNMTFSAPDWSLKQAAEAMLTGDFQHVVVVEPAGTLGTIAMVDVLRHWLK